MGVRGDFQKLEQLTSKLNGLAGEFRRELREQLAAEAVFQLQRGFELGRTPYGEAWAPLKSSRRRDRHGNIGSPLRDTGRLMNSYRAHATRTGFVVRTNVSYAQFHQYGTRRIPQRQQMPESDLGPIWSTAFDRVGSQLLEQYMGRAR